MKKYLPLYLYGSITTFAGIFLLFSDYSSFTVLKNTLGITLMVGAIFAFVTAFFRQNKHIQFAYHKLHAFAMLVYGIALLVFCNSLEKLVTFSTFLFIFYSFSEIIFCIWLFNLGQKVVYKIVAIRILLGLAIGIGAIVALNYSAGTMQVFGVLFVLVGLNVIFYIPVMRHRQSLETFNNVEQ